MTPERWSRVTHLVNEALDCPPDQRHAFLDSTCDGDESLRADVESLLAHADRTNGRLAEPWFRVDEALHRLTREGTAAPPMVLSVGMRLGPYEILSPLGQGGMGEVWRARDTRLARPVAIKVLSRDLMVSPQARERFQREARAIAALQHPHICTIYDVGETAGHQEFLVMELLEGETLHQRLARGPFDPGVLAEVGLALADALDTAHAAGLVHRDIKPANIFLTARGPKLLDFGLAKGMAQAAAGSMQITRSSPARLTDSGGTVGTVAYMSPEQLRGEPLDARTDLFSFGLVLYEMATGRPAFSGSTPAVVSAAILHEAPPQARQLRPDLPAALEHVLHKTLEKDRDLRCQSASELRADLKRLKRDLDSNGGPAKPLPLVSSGDTDAAQAAVPDSSDAPMGATLLQRHRGIAVLVAVVAVLAVVAVVATLWRATIGPGVNASVEPIHKQITFVGDVLDAALSPDGRTAAFITEDHGSRRLLVQDVTGGPSLEVARDEVYRFWWSPNGSQLLYATRRTGLFLVSRLGGPARHLDSMGWFVGWSPDGSRLALTTQDAQGFRIVGVEGELIRTVALPELRWINGMDWQRASNRLAILEVTAQNRFVLWSMTAEGQERRRVYSDADELASPQWASTGDTLYCLRIRNEAAELLAIDASRPEAKPRVLLSGLPGATSLSLAADGRSALMVRGTESFNLSRLNLNRPTDALTPITHGTGSFLQPKISKDGHWIAAISGAGTRLRIVKIPLTGGEPIPLTSGEDLVNSPAWSPDGQRIAFGSNRGGTPGVWVMNTDGQQQKKLDLGPVSGNLSVTWTPDGRIAWLQSTAGNFLNYRIRDLMSGEESFLANISSGGWVFSPMFSPQGDRIAVYWNRSQLTAGRQSQGRGHAMWLISWPERIETFLRERLTPIGWSPDGQSIYAASVVEGQPGLWVVSATTGESRPLADVPGVAGDHAAEGVGDVTPNGKELVLAIHERKADVWLVENFDPRAH